MDAIHEQKDWASKQQRGNLSPLAAFSCVSAAQNGTQPKTSAPAAMIPSLPSSTALSTTANPPTPLSLSYLPQNKISNKENKLVSITRDMSGIQESATRPSRDPQLPLCASSRFAKSCPQKRSGSYPAPHAQSAFLRYDFAARSESIGCDKHSLTHSFVVGPLPCHAAEPTFLSDKHACYNSILALRDDARRDPPERRSQAGSERASSRWLQGAKRNRCAEKRTRVRLGRTRRTFEQSIYRSGLKLKGVAGGMERDTQCSPLPPTGLLQISLSIFSSWSSAYVY